MLFLFTNLINNCVLIKSFLFTNNTVNINNNIIITIKRNENKN